MAFSENLKSARLEKGLSQQQLADLIGINRVCVTQYEKGIKKPTVDKAVKIATLLGTTCEKLFEE